MLSKRRLIRIELDEKTIVRRKPEIEHERDVAIFDLLEENYFYPDGEENGPFSLSISLSDNRLNFQIADFSHQKIPVVTLPISVFRSIIKNYFLICDSYFLAIKHSTPSRIEALDVERRSIHNEGAQILRGILAGKIDVDSETARRLFTLICVLHIRD